MLARQENELRLGCNRKGSHHVEFTTTSIPANKKAGVAAGFPAFSIRLNQCAASSASAS